MTPENAAATPVVVLDTNTVLDWLVFADARVQPLVRAIEADQVLCVTCPAMREELARMLVHPTLARWAPDASGALAHFDRWVALRDTPAANLHNGLRCTDADDQVFVDLALAEGARWLLSHDRALLKLARRAQRRGLRIARPRNWSLQT